MRTKYFDIILRLSLSNNSRKRRDNEDKNHNDSR
jgi:hypothetical protein